jgi:phage tail protein X
MGMATIHKTAQGEMIDAICRRVYGGESGYVEAVLEANPGLAALDAVLPIGTEIKLPDIPKASKVVPVISLWD